MRAKGEVKKLGYRVLSWACLEGWRDDRLKCRSDALVPCTRRDGQSIKRAKPLPEFVQSITCPLQCPFNTPPSSWRQSLKPLWSG